MFGSFGDVVIDRRAPGVQEIHSRIHQVIGEGFFVDVVQNACRKNGLAGLSLRESLLDFGKKVRK